MTKNMLDMSLDEIVMENRKGTKPKPTSFRRGVQNPGIKRQGRFQPGVEVRRPQRGTRNFGRGRDGGGRQRTPTRSFQNNWPQKKGSGWLEKPALRRSSGTLVRVSNLDYSILEDDLTELFQAVGIVEKVWVDFDKTDRSKGTGGCIFRNVADAHQAVRMYEGKKIEGMPIHLEVSERNPRRENSNSSRGSLRGYNDNGMEIDS